MLEFSNIKNNQQNHKRVLTYSSTQNLFTKIEQTSTNRNTRTVKGARTARGFPYLLNKQSLGDEKQNINMGGYLQKVKSSTKIDERKNLSNYLLSMRKEYDKMTQNVKKKIIEIERMKKQTQVMKLRSKVQDNYFKNDQEKVNSKTKNVTLIAEKEQSIKMQTKVLQHIIQRMKQDKLLYKQNNRKKQHYAKQKQRFLKAKQDELLQWDQTIHKIYNKISRMRKQFNKKTQERMLKFEEYNFQVEEIQGQEKFQLEKKERTQELLNMESNIMMDAKNNALREVVLVNKLLHHLLQAKINDLLTEHQDNTNAYHTIKNYTTIENPQEMSQLFFSYNTSLEESLSMIHSYQKKYQELLKKNQQLKSLKKQKLMLQLESQKQFNIELTNFDSEKENLKLQISNKELIKKKIICWGIEFMKTFDRNSLNNTIEQNIKAICEHLQEQMSKIDNEAIKNNKFESFIIRFKKTIKQLSFEDEKVKRVETQEAVQSINKQCQYLAHERNKLKKTHFHIKSQTNNKIK